MAKNVNPFTSLFSKAWMRDNKSNTVYRDDALLIALLAHTHGSDREGKDAIKVRELLSDHNLEKK